MATHPAPLVVFRGHASAEARAFISRTSRSDKDPGVFDLAFADNSTVVSGGMDNEARVWDANTGVERRFDVGDSTGFMNRTLNPIFAVAVARRRGVVATAAVDGCLRVFDVATGAEVGVCDAAGAQVAASWSPDERLIACGTGCGRITILRARHLFLTYRGRSRDPYLLDVEYPDGPTLVTAHTENFGDDDEDFVEREVLCRLVPISDGARFGNRSLAWLDATTLVAAERVEATRPRIVIWDVAQAMPIHRISIGLLAGLEIATSPIASLLAVGSLAGGQLYRRASPSAFQMTQILEPATSPAFTPDGDCLVLFSRRGVLILSAHSGAVTRYLRAPFCDDFGALALSPDGRRLAVTDRHANVQTFALDTPRSLLVKLLLLRVAPQRRKTRCVARTLPPARRRIGDYGVSCRKPREVEEYVDDGPDEEPRVVVEDTTLRLEAAGGVIVCTRQAPARSAAPRLLCRLADSGHVDTASYALKFLF